VATEDQLALADAVGSALGRLIRLVERKQAQRNADHPDAVERATYFEAVAVTGDGVFDTLKAVSKLVLKSLA